MKQRLSCALWGIGMEARAGRLLIGKGHPVSVQTMYDSALSMESAPDVVSLISKLHGLGCDMIRFSFVSEEDAEPFSYIARHSVIPVVADIHFDYRLALLAIRCGAHKVRINPGNIGEKWRTEEIVRAASDSGVAIRIGLNSGSLPSRKEGERDSDVMVRTALEYLDWFVSWGFDNTVVSLKSSDTEETMRAARMLSAASDVPQHIGVTEAGSPVISAVRSTWALGNLLSDGIGDTIRISMTGDVEDEVIASVELLRTLGLRKKGVRIVSCPRCGRHAFDTISFEKRIRERLLSLDKDITVAIMGCLVNGPGEAKGADWAVTGMKDKVYLYRKGCLIAQVDEETAEEALFEAIQNE